MTDASSVTRGSVSDGAPGPVVCIVGPTASGKSALADEVALALGSRVVSVDAMQVYRGMDVGTAKVPEAERRVPLEMVDVADLGEDYSVALFQRDARACVDALLEQGKTPVLCGGTGLYLDAVIDEMDFPSGESHNEARVRYEAYGREHGAQALWELLRERDAVSAELIHPNNVRRVVRALELLEQGKTYAENHEGLRAHVPHYDVRIWALTMARPRLYERINARVDKMMADGLVEEVKGLMEAGLGDALTARQAIGYKEVMAYLAGERTLAEATEDIKRQTRRYAKRQLSWLRRDGRARWVDLDETTVGKARELVLADLASKGTGTGCGADEGHEG